MAGRVLLDTNVVIALFSKQERTPQGFPESELFVSSTVLGELYFGALKSAQPAPNVAGIEQFAASVRLLSCDPETAKYYGEIRARLRSRGRPIPDNDIWIAAVALQYGLTLATRDAHFKEVEGLLVESW